MLLKLYSLVEFFDIIGISLTILQVMNKLDGQYYAVKKILIKQVSKEDCMKVNLQMFFML